jgi:hypothetical protein
MTGQLKLRMAKEILDRLDVGARREGRTRSNFARYLLVWALDYYEVSGYLPPKGNRR